MADYVCKRIKHLAQVGHKTSLAGNLAVEQVREFHDAVEQNKQNGVENRIEGREKIDQEEDHEEKRGHHKAGDREPVGKIHPKSLLYLSLR